MNTRAAVVALTIFVTGATLVSLPACATQKVEENVTVPTLDRLSLGVESDAALGLEYVEEDEQAVTAENMEDFFAAVRSGDRLQYQAVAVPLWPIVQDVAELGVKARLANGQIGPLGAESLRERHRNFENLFTQVAFPTTEGL